MYGLPSTVEKPEEVNQGKMHLEREKLDAASIPSPCFDLMEIAAAAYDLATTPTNLTRTTSIRAIVLLGAEDTPARNRFHI